MDDSQTAVVCAKIWHISAWCAVNSKKIEEAGQLEGKRGSGRLKNLSTGDEQHLKVLKN